MRSNLNVSIVCRISEVACGWWLMYPATCQRLGRPKFIYNKRSCSFLSYKSYTRLCNVPTITPLKETRVEYRNYIWKWTVNESQHDLLYTFLHVKFFQAIKTGNNAITSRVFIRLLNYNIFMFPWRRKEIRKILSVFKRGKGFVLYFISRLIQVVFCLRRRNVELTKFVADNHGFLFSTFPLRSNWQSR